VTPKTGERAYVMFRLDGEGFALSVDVVTGIVRFEAPTPVPRAPFAVMGVVNLRGRVVPVVDLKARFGLGTFAGGPHSRIVVAEGSHGAVGIAVDAVSEVARFLPDDIQPPPEEVVGRDTTGAFMGMVEYADGLVIVLDPEYAMYADATSAPQSGADGRKEETPDV